MSGPLNQLYKADEISFKDASLELEDKKNAVGGRPPLVFSSLEKPWFFWIMAILVGFAEVYTNKELFDMVFQGTAAKSLFVASVLSVSLMVVSHVAGLASRQIWSESEQKWVANRIFASIITNGIALSAILLLMIVRVSFTLSADSQGGIGDIFGSIADQVKAVGILGLLSQALKSTEALTLGFFNLLCLSAAFLVGFFSHDSDINYDKAYSNFKKAKSSFQKRQSVYESRLESVHKQYSKKIDIARQAFVTAKSKINDSNKVSLELPEDNFARERHEAETIALSNV